MRTFAIATTSTWFSEDDLAGFSEDISWSFVTSPEELTREKLLRLQPEKIFFLHWNQKIPEDIFGSWECIVFHTAPLPSGRGGSPIQNLIEQGYTRAPLNALRVVEELDAGPIYARTEIDLTGSLKEIFDRIRLASIELLDTIIAEDPVPFEQEGNPLLFKRRTPEMSRINGDETLESLYDKIRMVDYEGYPRAFIQLGRFLIRFSDAEKSKDSLFANVVITELEP